MAEPNKTSQMSYAWLLLIVPTGLYVGGTLRMWVSPCRMSARQAARSLYETDPRGVDGTANVTQATNYNQTNQNQNMDTAPVSSGNGGNRFDNSDGMTGNASFNV